MREIPWWIVASDAIKLVNKNALEYDFFNLTWALCFKVKV
jgi:hypothetical protein